MERYKRINAKPKDSAVGKTAAMKTQTVTVSVALLALCCLLIPKGGESAGGIVSLKQAEGEKHARDQLQDESLDDPQGLAGDSLGSSLRSGREVAEETGT